MAATMAAAEAAHAAPAAAVAAAEAPTAAPVANVPRVNSMLNLAWILVGRPLALSHIAFVRAEFQTSKHVLSEPTFPKSPVKKRWSDNRGGFVAPLGIYLPDFFFLGTRARDPLSERGWFPDILNLIHHTRGPQLSGQTDDRPRKVNHFLMEVP
jgi:hypothetical protein